jgi:ferredoxin
MEGIDERDTIFSRMELRPGDGRYESYYAEHPERQQRDDTFRALSASHADQRLLRSVVDSTFELLAEMRPLARGPAVPSRLDLSPPQLDPSPSRPDSLSQRLDPSPAEATALLDALARSYGAVLFGTARLGDACFYSVRGRGAEWGETVATPWRQGAVFAVAMRPAEIAAAPQPRESVEVVNGYARVALIGLVLARCIRGWGWNAACTMDGRADVILPVAARYAGLGSIGRSGLLLADKYGPCLRLGAVVTDLPLGPTPRLPARAARLCASCDRCAQACPAGAIPAAAFKPIDDDACFAQWQRLGTDCGICVAVCPHSRIKVSL